MSEQSIFLAVLDISDPAERAAFLATACAGNEALRKEVEALLAAHDRPGAFLDQPAVAQMPDSGAGETRTVAPGGDPDFAETRSPDSTSGIHEDDVLAFLQPPTRTGSLGRLAHYEVLEVLGCGGFGTVLRAFDDRLHRVVAIKVMAPQLAASGAARARFLREGRSAAAVRDNHVVNVYGVSGDDEAIPYLVMELVAGQTLQQKIDRVGPLSVQEVLRIGSQIAYGLAAAHANGLIHRDIKPANILLENGVERVKITDFGLARAADDASISQSGVVAGTPMYMAPEQARGEAIDHRADLFSLGSVLYVMCTGRPPFRAETTLAVLKRVCEDDPRPMREVNPQVPQWLADVVAKLHAKNPAERFQSAKEVADLLADCERQVQTHGSLADASRIPGALPKPVGGRSRLRAGVLIALVLALAVTFFRPTSAWAGALLLSTLVGIAVVIILDPRDPVAGEPSRRSRRRVVALAALVVFLPFVTWAVYAATRPRPDPEDDRAQLAINWEERALVVMVFGDDGVNYLSEGATKGTGMQLKPGTYTVRAQRGGEIVFEQKVTLGPRTHRGINIPGPSAAVRPVSEDGFVSLFNGKDLTGWKTHPEQPGVWRVENNELVADGKHSSHLFSLRDDFTDYHLRIELKVSDEGVATQILRAPFNLDRVWRPGPVTYHIPNGLVFPIMRDGGQMQRIAWLWGFEAKDSRPFRDPKIIPANALHIMPNQWFTQDILVRGNRVTFPSASYFYVDDSGQHPKGHIVLGHYKGKVQIRKIEIKELPPAPDERRENFARLKGEWVVRSGKVGGQPLPQAVAGTTIRFAGDGFELQRSGDPLKGTFNIDAEKNQLLLRPDGKDFPTRCSYRFDGDRLILDFPRPRDFQTGSTKPFVPGASAAAFRNLERIGLAMHKYANANGSLPPAAVVGKDGKPLLSWRVALLPHLGYVSLYKQFNLDEPWDGPNNKKLIDKRPQVFAPSGIASKAGHTHYRVFVGPGSAFEPRPGGAGLKFADFPDGLSNTILVAEAAASVEWTKPDDLPFNPKVALPALGVGGRSVGARVLLGDGSTGTLQPDATDKVTRMFITRNGNEPFDDESLTREPLNGPSLYLELRPVAPPPPAVAPFSAVKAKELQEQWAKHSGVAVEFENSIGMKMRLIPPGEFTMGSSKEEIAELLKDPEIKSADWHQDGIRKEGPTRRVAVSEPFYLGIHEVTVGQFKEFVTATKYKTQAEKNGGGHKWVREDGLAGMTWQSPKYAWNSSDAGGDFHPVTFVTVADAKAFCAWLEEKDGHHYVLPSDEQWEYACRAGTEARWFFGADPAAMKQYGWTYPHSEDRTHPVGHLGANPFGLFDVYGNVSEFTLVPPNRVNIRGGAVTSSPLFARSAERFADEKLMDAYYGQGFRVAIVGNLKPAPPTKKEPNLTVLQPLRDAVAARGRVVAEVKLRFEAGKVSKLDLLAAQVELREAQIKLAEAEADTPILILHLRELVKLREEERELIGLRVKVGVERRSALDDADARLADAKARLAKVRPPEVAPPPRPRP